MTDRVGPSREWIAVPQLWQTGTTPEGVRWSTPINTPEMERWTEEFYDALYLLKPWLFCRHCANELTPDDRMGTHDDGRTEWVFWCDRCHDAGRTEADVRDLQRRWPDNADAFDN